MKSVICRSLLLLCFVLATSPAYPSERAASPMVGWVGLYNSEMIGWLENQNRIEELCPNSLGAAQQKCRSEKLKPRTWAIEVRERPDTKSALLGAIVITAAPGQGLTAAFHSGQETKSFLPDLFDADWGYGPHFHQTFLENRGSWFLLPRNPFPVQGWIDISRLSQEPDIKHLEAMKVYELDGKGIVITAIRKDSVTIRDEQPEDMWCKEGDPPKTTPGRMRDISLAALLDRDGHLKLRIKYTRGC